MGQQISNGNANKFELIQHFDVTASASVTFSNAVIANYKSLLLVFDLLHDTNNNNLQVTFNNDAGANYDTYYRVFTTFVMGSALAFNAAIVAAGGAASASNAAGYCWIPRVRRNGKIKIAMFGAQAAAAGIIGVETVYTAAADVTRIDFACNTGTFTGFATLFGIKET